MSRSKPSLLTFALYRTSHKRSSPGFVRSCWGKATCLALLVAPAVLLQEPVAARTLEAVRSRGVITVCAHANALPFSSRKDDPPGFQIELARALAQQLDLGLAVAWVVTPNQYRAADCDIVLDTIVDPEVQAESRKVVAGLHDKSLDREDDVLIARLLAQQERILLWELRTAGLRAPPVGSIHSFLPTV